MKRSSRCLLVAVVLAGGHPLPAQVTMTPLTTFGGGDGWLAPGEGGYPYLGTGSTERGLAYGNDHLYLVSRAGGSFIRILDPLTGADLGALNASGITGGIFPVNMIAAGGDGTIYVGNLTVDASSAPFTVYKWATEGATPAIGFTGAPLAGGRVGDSLAAIGSGSSTLLAAGFGNAPNVPGNNGYAIINPAAGTSTQVMFSGPPPFAGDFRLGVAFTDPNHVLGGQSSSIYRHTSFSGTTGTLLASPRLLSDEPVLAYAVVNGRPLLATLATSGFRESVVSIYDVRDSANPLFLTEGRNLSGTPSANSNRTGALAWGNFSGNTAKLYAMSTNQGIQAWTVTVPSFVVTTLADHDDGSCDGGDCTLREAIKAANSLPDADIVTFASGVTGTIQLSSALPQITSNLSIFGPGAHLLTVRRNTGGDYRIFTIDHANVSISGLRISDGRLTASGSTGAGIFNDAGSLTLTSCALTGHAGYAAGALYNGGGNAVVNNCTFSDNSAFEGGAIDNAALGDTAILAVTNSTFSSNSASSNGGAISNGSAAGTAISTVINCTFSDNSSPVGGAVNTGAFFGGTATTTLRNSILRTGVSGANLANSGGVVTSQDRNLSNDNGGGFLNASGDLINTNPRLGPLQNNGGQTSTHALLSGSPAINAGNGLYAPPMDQRGYLRSGASDIGAFEFGGAPLRFLSFRLLPNGHVSMEAMGVPDAPHTIERSLDLSASGFIPFPPTTADSSGLIRFTDTTSVGLERAFYRLTFP